MSIKVLNPADFPKGEGGCVLPSTTRDAYANTFADTIPVSFSVPGLTDNDKEQFSLIFNNVGRQLIGLLRLRGSDVTDLTINIHTGNLDNLTEGNIKHGVTILGTTGTFERDPDANLVPENIKKDVVIYGVTGTYEGTT